MTAQVEWILRIIAMALPDRGGCRNAQSKIRKFRIVVAATGKFRETARRMRGLGEMRAFSGMINAAKKI